MCGCGAGVCGGARCAHAAALLCGRAVDLGRRDAASASGLGAGAAKASHHARSTSQASCCGPCRRKSATRRFRDTRMARQRGARVQGEEYAPAIHREFQIVRLSREVRDAVWLGVVTREGCKGRDQERRARGAERAARHGGFCAARQHKGAYTRAVAYRRAQLRERAGRSLNNTGCTLPSRVRFARVGQAPHTAPDVQEKVWYANGSRRARNTAYERSVLRVPCTAPWRGLVDTVMRCSAPSAHQQQHSMALGSPWYFCSPTTPQGRH